MSYLHRRLPAWRIPALASVAAVIVLLAAGGPGTSRAATIASAGGGTVVFGYPSIVPRPYGIEGWGIHTGIFQRDLAKVGITHVETVLFANGPNVGAAQEGGSVDVAGVGDTPAISTKASGVDTEVLNINELNEDAYLLVADNGPKTLAQLKGKTVATAEGSYMDKYLKGLLKLEGLSGSTTEINLLPTGAYAALKSGQIAAYAAADTEAPFLLAKGGLRILDHAALHPDLTGTDVDTVTASFAKAHPGFVQAWDTAFQQSVQNAEAHPAAFFAYQAFANEATVAQAKVFDSFAHWPSSPMPALAFQRLESTEQFLVQDHLISTPVNIKAWLAPGVTVGS